MYILGSLYRSNAKTQMDLIYFNYLPHLLHGRSRTLHFALLKLGFPKPLCFYQARRNSGANAAAVEILSIVIISILIKARPENKSKKFLSGLRGKIPAKPYEVNSKNANR